MSQILINDYLKQLDLIKKVSGSHRESIVREAFKDLLKAWGRQHGPLFLAEYPLKTATKSNIAVDDGPKPTGLRYCNNGLALKFVPDKA